MARTIAIQSDLLFGLFSTAIGDVGIVAGLREMARAVDRVGDAQHVSNRIAFGGVVSMSFRSWAQGIVERYSSQKVVRVWVCPTDPALSVLEPGLHWTSWMVPLVFAVFFGLGLRILLRYVGVLG